MVRQLFFSRLTVQGQIDLSRNPLPAAYLVDLEYGINRVNIQVTSEYGSTRTYTVSIKRKDNRSSDWSLASLSVDVGSSSWPCLVHWSQPPALSEPVAAACLLVF